MTLALAALIFAPSDGGDFAGASPRDSTHQDNAHGDHVHDGARDSALAERVRASDEDASESLFHMYADALIRYANSYLHDEDAAREVVSDAFLAIWERRQAWSPTHGVAAYLYGAVRNRSLNYTRSARRRAGWMAAAAREPEMPGLGAEQSDGITDELLARIRHAVSQLPPARREATILRWDHHRTPEEIAEILQGSRTAVYHLLERSLKTLREVSGAT